MKKNLKKVKPRGPKHRGRGGHLPPLSNVSKPVSEAEVNISSQSVKNKSRVEKGENYKHHFQST